MSFSADLKNTLTQNPNITTVYFNAACTQWIFSSGTQQSLNTNLPGINPFDQGVTYNTALTPAYIQAN